MLMSSTAMLMQLFLLSYRSPTTAALVQGAISEVSDVHMMALHVGGSDQLVTEDPKNDSSTIVQPDESDANSGLLTPEDPTNDSSTIVQWDQDDANMRIASSTGNGYCGTNVAINSADCSSSITASYINCRDA